MAKKKGKGGRGRDRGGEAAATAETGIAEVPEFFDEDGVLRSLKGADFPKSLDGLLAHVDYQIAKLEAKKKRIAERNDPKAKVKRKMERYRKLIAELEDELGDD